MSRIAKNPLKIINGVQVELTNPIVIKGAKGQMSFDKSKLVEIENKENTLYFSIPKTIKKNKEVAHAWMMAGTARSILNNMIVGVSTGYEKTLVLVGVGYRAKLEGKQVVLNLGFSHDVIYALPDDISVEIKSPTEIIIKGINKQRVGQVAAEIRSYRPPEPYKGKGVLYKNENLTRKEVRKKT